MNKHLTLQELKVQNKVPIWVEDTEYPKNSGWHIIEWNNGKYLCLIGLSSKRYTVEEYGESWFAYRFNPHEDSIEKDFQNACEILCKLILLCETAYDLRREIFRPIKKGIGDYMGTGYAFLDRYNRIMDEDMSSRTYEMVKQMSVQFEEEWNWEKYETKKSM